MRLRVSVPVLSVHSVVADPKVSMVAARRASTRALDKRSAPMAMNTARTTGNSSGSIDIPIAMPASKASSHSPRDQPCSRKANRLTTPPSEANQITSRRVCRRRSGEAVSTSPSSLPIRPIALVSPVAVTSTSA